jgi:hypothetical protein
MNRTFSAVLPITSASLSRVYVKTGCRNRVDLAKRFAATPA